MPYVYGLQVTWEQIVGQFGALVDPDGSAEDWFRRNPDAVLTPTRPHALNLNPIVRERVRPGERRRSIDLAWWQLWVGAAPASFKAVHARDDKLLSASSWIGPTRERRVLLPATWYEEKGHRFSTGGLFAMAGIANVTPRPDGSWLVSYAMVTRDATPEIAPIHDRMPLIVAPELYDAWLDPERIGDRALVDETVAASETVSRGLEIR